MSAHSPGPWRVVFGEQNICEPMVSVVDANGDTVCDNETYYPQALNPENASVIAATPDLLKALEAAVADYDQIAAAPDEMNLDWVDDARAAIAKAKGVES